MLTRLLVLASALFISLGVPAQDCESLLKVTSEKIEILERKIGAVEDLLKAQNRAVMPLTVLFQVDLKDEKSVQKRAEELGKLQEKKEILATEEYAPFAKCSEKGAIIEALDELLQSHITLNKKKLSFLSLPSDKRVLLIDLFETALKNSASERNLESQLDQSEASIDAAKETIQETESESIETVDSSKGDELLSAMTLLGNFIIDIESEHIEFIKFIKKEQEKMGNLRTRLQGLMDIRARELSETELSEKFEAVDGIWNLTAELLLEVFATEIGTDYKLPKRMKAQDFGVETVPDSFKKYATDYAKARRRFEFLLEAKKNLLTELKALNFRLLNDSGHLRAELIKECHDQGVCEGVQGLNEKYLRSFAREIQILPLKFLAGGLNKMVEFRGKLKAGFDSWVDLARQLSVLLFIILLPFLAHRLLSWISGRLDAFRASVLSRSIMDYRKRTQLATWISRLNPFVPSVGMIASIHLARALLETTDLRELSYLLFYLELYFIYRACRIILRIALEYFFSHESLEKEKEKGLRAEITARRLSRLFFLQYGILHLIEDTVRRALVYEAVNNVVIVVGLIIFVLEFRNWREEIIRSFQHRYPKIWTRVSRYIESQLGSLLLPLLLVASIGHTLAIVISQQLIRFDFFKRILSDLFRRKIARSEKEAPTKVAPSSEYLSFFDYYRAAGNEVYVDREPIVASGVLSSIERWLSGESTDDLVILIGNRGLGKTTMLRTIERRAECPEKTFQRVPSRITTLESFYIWISGVFGAEIKNSEDFKRVEESLSEKRLVIIDDVHNLFIGQVGGFEAYKAFIEIISLRSKNIFWCLSVNSHSWTYLQGVYGKDHFYGRTFKLRMWTDDEIQRMILKRHENTGYSRTFDESITAYGTGNVLGEKMETQFFRLLWGQSRGNPRSAMMHWISAISEPEAKNVHVGVPKFIHSATVGTMSTEALTILAAIARHDSLSPEELLETTGVDKIVIRKCLKEAHDKDLLWSDASGRIRISSRAQNAIDYYLIGKNFLYE